VFSQFVDSFDGSVLDPSWKVLRGAGSYSLTENPGHLRTRMVPATAAAPSLAITKPFRGENGCCNRTSGISLARQAEAGFSDSQSHSVRHEYPADTILTIWFASYDTEIRGMTAVKAKHTGKCGKRVRAFLEPLIPINASDSYVWQVSRNGRTMMIRTRCWRHELHHCR